MKYEAIAVTSSYIEPNEGYEKLVESIANNCQDNDYVIISETPISIAEGNLLDESEYNPEILAITLCEVWSKYLWGYILARVFNLKKRTIRNLKIMPKKARNHKQLILEEYGLKYALMPTAEAGVDLSNVAGNYVSKLPENPRKSAKEIKNILLERYNKNIEVVIIDTDATYSFLGHKYTTLPKSIDSIRNSTGIYGILLSRFSNKCGSTVLASTDNSSADFLINLGNIAEDTQLRSSENFFETVYDMKNEFDCNYEDVTIDDLKTIRHTPCVLVRFK